MGALERRCGKADAGPGASALDSLALVPAFLDRLPPRLKRYQGDVHLDQVREALFARIEREKAAMKQALGELQQQLENMQGDDAESGQNPKELGEFQPQRRRRGRGRR